LLTAHVAGDDFIPKRIPLTLIPIRLLKLVPGAFLCAALFAHGQTLNSNYARDPNQPIDQPYSDHIKKYTTDPSFISPLVDYLPASIGRRWPGAPLC
jgi:hypothetical protein